ncbi:succinate dehydrogenase assembly factor 2 [Rhodobacteraceae bacterium LMO-12]|nr:succinate dehydrogenase assembly factor 2 [Rhodobacteraceae bacterium LMO-JJ12]
MRPEGESREARLKRMKMRSMRRGTKEMDLILMRFAEERLDAMNEERLDAYDRLLSENDQDLYQWVSGQAKPPANVLEMVFEIRSALDTD